MSSPSPSPTTTPTSPDSLLHTTLSFATLFLSSLLLSLVYAPHPSQPLPRTPPPHPRSRLRPLNLLSTLLAAGLNLHRTPPATTFRSECLAPSSRTAHCVSTCVSLALGPVIYGAVGFVLPDVLSAAWRKVPRLTRQERYLAGVVVGLVLGLSACWAVLVRSGAEVVGYFVVWCVVGRREGVFTWGGLGGNVAVTVLAGMGVWLMQFKGLEGEVGRWVGGRVRAWRGGSGIGGVKSW
ncbi:hypothetical protein BDZ85DRAFT_286623 [Elsinoe ampelina]|uniref:Uncharacterized protein n=1 Tax=Elsinoe ampelina TaxID=302913 RepID=A0A6A6FXA8_9PEZI|nr:hypothetical protein BDZ85DRAFT_286623 [Elsinoe ampelina]